MPEKRSALPCAMQRGRLAQLGRVRPGIIPGTSAASIHSVPLPSGGCALIGRASRPY